jgi:hypothetical protein
MILTFFLFLKEILDLLINIENLYLSGKNESSVPPGVAGV